MSSLSFSVPLLPPSVNHYKQPRRGGGFYRAAECMSFIEAVCILSRKTPVAGVTYELDLTFYLPPSKRSLKSNDLDNFLKVSLDALATAGVITNDGAVLDLHIHKRFVKTEGEARTHYSVQGKDGEHENETDAGGAAA